MSLLSFEDPQSAAFYKRHGCCIGSLLSNRMSILTPGSIRHPATRSPSNCDQTHCTGPWIPSLVFALSHEHRPPNQPTNPPLGLPQRTIRLIFRFSILFKYIGWLLFGSILSSKNSVAISISAIWVSLAPVSDDGASQNDLLALPCRFYSELKSPSSGVNFGI